MADSIEPTNIAGSPEESDSCRRGRSFDAEAVGVIESEEAYRSTLLGQLDRRFLAAPPVQIVLVVLLGLALVIPSVQFLVRIQEVETAPHREGDEHHRTALGRWLPTADLLSHVAEAPRKGETANPYGYGHWFPLPPFILMMLVPLAKIGYTPAAVLWAAAKVVGFVVGMLLLIRGLKRDDFSVPIGVILMTAVFSLRPVVSDIQHGNVNTFMMIWLALTWGLYVRRHDFWAGIFLALAVVTKLTPLLALAYFLYKGAWRVCAGAAVGLALFFLVIPALYLGLGENVALLRSWFDMLVAPYALEGYAMVNVSNQSLYGVILRLGSEAGALSLTQMPLEQVQRIGIHEMVRPTGALVSFVRPALSLVVVGGLAWVCRTRCRSRRDVRLLLEFGLVLVAMLLLSERTWKHHATTLPIVYLALWYALTCVPWSDRFRGWFFAGMVVQWLLLTGTGEALLGGTVADALLFLGVYCWGLVLCLVQGMLMMRALDRISVSPTERVEAM